MLQLDHLSFGYGPITAVEQVNIQLNAGELVVIVGGNGAGKSTLLKGVAGLLMPTHGRIIFNGLNISVMPPHKRVAHGIALSPEGRQVFPDQTVHDNLLLGAYFRKLGVTEFDAEIERQFTLFPRLRERRDQLAVTLSGGEQQMLAIARALMGRPKLLLLDEPSLGLAPKVIQEIFRIILTLRKAGITILLVEQMANMALAVADRGYVFETGNIVLSGTGQELLANPKVQAAYLGSARK